MSPPFTQQNSLSSPHGFFGRQGGVSKGVYDSLNTGQRSDDDIEAVTINRKRVQEALGAKHLVSLAQIHSTEVVILDTPPDDLIEADGIVTRTPGLAVSALSADCGPILFEDPNAGIVAACHAGWRGAVSGIIETTIATMCELGAHPDSLVAVLGPCISQPNYEVGDAFKADILALDESHETFFVDSPKGIPHFDLPGFILSRLEACGVEKRSWTGQCTYADAKRFFSYRRNTHQGLQGYGRNISAIMLAQ